MKKKIFTPVNIRDFPEDIHRELKVLAAQRGITLKALILEILEKEIRKIKS